MFKTLLTFGFLGAHILCVQSINAQPNVHDAVKAHATKIFDELVAVRRDLHRHPELSGEEQRTSRVVADYLRAAGLEVKTNVGGYGVVGILHGAKPGKKIAWRADMDAIKSEAPDSVEFTSEVDGIRHGCGHDVHTAVGLGIANTLASQKENLAGTIYFLFQPAEENLQGAQAMIDDGLFDVIQPDELYGLHIAPFAVGSIATKTGLVYSHTRRLRLIFSGTEGVDRLKEEINQVLSNLAYSQEDTKPWEMQYLLDPSVGIANPNTMYRDYLILSEQLKHKVSDGNLIFETGFVTSDGTELPRVLKQIQQQLGQSSHGDRFNSVAYIGHIPAVMNDEKMTHNAIEAVRSLYGDESVQQSYGVIPFFNDDFAHFQHRIPGVYFFLGGSNTEKEIVAMPHAPDFAVDERSIEVGVRYFSSLIIERLTANHEKSN